MDRCQIMELSMAGVLLLDFLPQASPGGPLTRADRTGNFLGAVAALDGIIAAGLARNEILSTIIDDSGDWKPLLDAGLLIRRTHYGRSTYAFAQPPMTLRDPQAMADLVAKLFQAIDAAHPVAVIVAGAHNLGSLSIGNTGIALAFVRDKKKDPSLTITVTTPGKIGKSTVPLTGLFKACGLIVGLDTNIAFHAQGQRWLRLTQDDLGSACIVGWRSSVRPYNFMFMEERENAGNKIWVESSNTFLHSYFGRLATVANGWAGSGGPPQFLANLRRPLTEVNAARENALLQWGRALVSCHHEMLPLSYDFKLLRRRLWREAGSADGPDSFYLYTIVNPRSEATARLVPVTKEQRRWAQWKSNVRAIKTIHLDKLKLTLPIGELRLRDAVRNVDGTTQAPPQYEDGNILSDLRAVAGRLRALSYPHVPAQIREAGPNIANKADVAELCTAIALFKCAVIGLQALSKFKKESYGDIWPAGRIAPGDVIHRWLVAENAPVWRVLSESGAGFVNAEVRDKPYPKGDKDPLHMHATSWLDQAIRDAGQRYERDYRKGDPMIALITINDASMAEGGNTPSHGGHETGQCFDMLLPHNDGQAGTITWRHNDYDSLAMENQLRAIWADPNVGNIVFNDPRLIDLGLCHALDEHDNHAHVNLNPPRAIPSAA
jgi:hypothetical protein